MHWRTLPTIVRAPPLPEGVRLLSSLVQGPSALARRLGQIGVTDTDAEAAALAPSLLQGQRLVSREGGLWRWDGFTVFSGASTPATTSLEQRNRLTELRVQLTKQQNELKTAESARDHQQKIENI